MNNGNSNDKLTQKQIIGRKGEDIACDYLKNSGFKIIERNYLRKWGELDIVAQKAKTLHFIEVKTVSRDLSVIHETQDAYRPEDNMHPWKLKRLSRAIQTFLMEGELDDEWLFDLITVYIDEKNKKSQVSFIEDIVL